MAPSATTTVPCIKTIAASRQALVDRNVSGASGLKRDLGTPRGDVKVAALGQVAADLLTSPGRGPDEAEALIDWMQQNEGAWRAWSAGPTVPDRLHTDQA